MREEEPSLRTFKSVNSQRAISLILVVVFIATNPSAPAYAISAVPPLSENQKGFPAKLDAIKVPIEIGKVEDVYKGKSDKVIVLVQDAHAIPDAQRNIRKLIGHFQKQYGLDLVALEGASSNLDMQIFKSFPDKEILKKTFEDYFDKGELTGSTAAAIFNDAKTTYEGVEDWGLYEQGLSLYLSAMKNEPVLLEKISSLEKDLQAKKTAAYSKQLLEIDQNLQSFRENHSDIAQILKMLAQVKRPEKGTEVAMMLEESERDSADQAPVEIEVKNLAKTIEAFLNSQPPSPENNKSLQAFHEKYQEFQTSRLSPQAFALFLKEQARLPVEVSSQLSHLIKNQKRMKDIEGTKFFRDFENYADSVKQALLRNEEERKLDQESRKLEILERLIKLELSRQDWKEVKASIEGLTVNLPQDSLKFHIAFYENAEKRDQAFTDNLISEMQTSKAESALLVAGGFHAEGLTQRLKEKGISYLLLMPQIGLLPEHSVYQDRMKGEVSWKKYFEIEDGKINLYKAFVRGVRDKLLGQSKEDSKRLLKNWRDQIIRDLAGSEKLAKTGEYTPFIDEVSQSGNPKREAAKQFDKVDEFINRLRRLESKGELTEQNVLKLLQPATAQPAVLVPAVGSLISAENINGEGVVNTALRSEARQRDQEPAEISSASQDPSWDAILQAVQDTMRKIKKNLKNRTTFQGEGLQADIERVAGLLEKYQKSFPANNDSTETELKIIETQLKINQIQNVLSFLEGLRDRNRNPINDALMASAGLGGKHIATGVWAALPWRMTNELQDIHQSMDSFWEYIEILWDIEDENNNTIPFSESGLSENVYRLFNVWIRNFQEYRLHNKHLSKEAIIRLYQSPESLTGLSVKGIRSYGEFFRNPDGRVRFFKEIGFFLDALEEQKLVPFDDNRVFFTEVKQVMEEGLLSKARSRTEALQLPILNAAFGEEAKDTIMKIMEIAKNREGGTLKMEGLEDDIKKTAGILEKYQKSFPADNNSPEAQLKIIETQLKITAIQNVLTFLEGLRDRKRNQIKAAVTKSSGIGVLEYMGKGVWAKLPQSVTTGLGYIKEILKDSAEHIDILWDIEDENNNTISFSESGLPENAYRLFNIWIRNSQEQRLHNKELSKDEIIRLYQSPQSLTGLSVNGILSYDQLFRSSRLYLQAQIESLVDILKEQKLGSFNKPIDFMREVRPVMDNDLLAKTRSRAEVRSQPMAAPSRSELRKTIRAAVIVDGVLNGQEIPASARQQASKIVVTAGPDQFGDILKAVAAHDAQSAVVKREQARLIAAYEHRFPNQPVAFGIIFPQEMSQPDLANVSDSLRQVRPDTLVVPRRLKFLDILKRIGAQLRQVDFSRSSFMDQEALSVAVLEDQVQQNLAGMYVPVTSRGANKVDNYLERGQVRFIQLLSTGITSQLLKENPKLASSPLELRAELLKVLGPMYAQAINAQGQGFDVNPLEVRVMTEYLARAEVRKAA